MQKILLFAVTVMCCCRFGAAAPAEFTTMRLDADQAFIPWAMPLDGGPLRTLFIAPRHTLRDATGLGDRLELELSTVALPTGSSLGDDDQQAAVLKELEQGLKSRLDVIIAANIDAGVLPEAAWQAIADHVRGGSAEAGD
jgi:hypothetical protein